MEDDGREREIGIEGRDELLTPYLIFRIVFVLDRSLRPIPSHGERTTKSTYRYTIGAKNTRPSNRS